VEILKLQVHPWALESGARVPSFQSTCHFDDSCCNVLAIMTCYIDRNRWEYEMGLEAGVANALTPTACIRCWTLILNVCVGVGYVSMNYCLSAIMDAAAAGDRCTMTAALTMNSVY
jgi:hypothetical protein